jgi:phage-related minor tail protein
MASLLNPTDLLKSFQARAEFMLNADRHMQAVVEMLTDTHDVLKKLAGVVDRLDATIKEVEKRVGGVGQVIGRMDRLEEAALNIERATMKVEGALTALPRAVRTRITKAIPGSKSDDES